MASSMFERYGGFASVSKIVMSFYDKALDSDVIGDFFEDVDMPNLIDHQTKFIAMAMGGPASYTNEMLRQVHADLEIDTAAFNEAVSLLQETLEEFELKSEDIGIIIEDIRNRAQYIIGA
ncbi:MAG: group 1 truncated hemoglobin [Alphaproteobacteria bacterium]|nr:group 1 truncated hemoglobin [Alphaproteobacteria bacterium]